LKNQTKTVLNKVPKTSFSHESYEKIVKRTEIEILYQVW